MDKKIDTIPIDWIEAWIKKLESVDNAITKRDAMAIKSMLTKWKMEQHDSSCNEDYCEIGGNHG